MTAAQYQKSLKRIIYLMSCETLTPEGKELEALSNAVLEYENKHCPIEQPCPIEAIKFRVDQLGMKQSDLYSFFGSQTKTSEVLNKKRGLSKAMIRKLHYGLGVSLEVLIQDYELVGAK